MKEDFHIYRVRVYFVAEDFPDDNEPFILSQYSCIFRELIFSADQTSRYNLYLGISSFYSEKYLNKFFNITINICWHIYLIFLKSQEKIYNLIFCLKFA